jgi:hypothetical protein
VLALRKQYSRTRLERMGLPSQIAKYISALARMRLGYEWLCTALMLGELLRQHRHRGRQLTRQQSPDAL